MERSVLMVDAGYLFAQGGLSAHGTKSRKELTIDADRFLATLTALIGDHSGLPLLRSYWYDGARHGIPAKDHLEIARLPYLKLRLGRLNSRNQQKGVDSLIYRDLMTLASERSITQAYLLSGDDDLREGVLFAQDRGVRVILLGIPDRGGDNSQSRELQHEADEVITLNRSLVSENLSRLPQRSTTLASQTASINEESVVAVARDFAESWCAAASEEARLNLAAEYPQIPKNLDVTLIKRCEELLNFNLWDDQHLKQVARRAFWQLIKPRNS